MAVAFSVRGLAQAICDDRRPAGLGVLSVFSTGEVGSQPDAGRLFGTSPIVKVHPHFNITQKVGHEHGTPKAQTWPCKSVGLLVYRPNVP